MITLSTSVDSRYMYRGENLVLNGFFASLFSDTFPITTVFTVFRLLTDFVCLYNYEF